MDKLYENIKNRRIALGMTQEDLHARDGRTEEEGRKFARFRQNYVAKM